MQIGLNLNDKQETRKNPTNKLNPSHGARDTKDPHCVRDKIHPFSLSTSHSSRSLTRGTEKWARVEPTSLKSMSQAPEEDDHKEPKHQTGVYKSLRAKAETLSLPSLGGSLPNVRDRFLTKTKSTPSSRTISTQKKRPHQDQVINPKSDVNPFQKFTNHINLLFGYAKALATDRDYLQKKFKKQGSLSFPSFFFSPIQWKKKLFQGTLLCLSSIPFFPN